MIDLGANRHARAAHRARQLRSILQRHDRTEAAADGFCDLFMDCRELGLAGKGRQLGDKLGIARQNGRQLRSICLADLRSGFEVRHGGDSKLTQG